MADARCDAIVVGAGVIGMLSALALAGKGWKVAVVERGKAGRESTWAGGGMLAPPRPWEYPERVWQIVERSRALYPALAEQLRNTTGVDPELLQCGAMLHDPPDHHAARAWHHAHRMPIAEAGDWLHMPWLGQIRNPRLARALTARLPQAGVRLYEDTPMETLLLDGDRVRGIAAGGRELHAPHVVIAAGAWSGTLCDDAPAIRPVRGQMLLLYPRPAPEPVIRLIPGAYVIVRADGHVLVGSTVEEAGFDKSVTATARSDLLAAVARYVPELDGAPVEAHWAGLRPGSADGEPVIGPDLRRRGLWWNTGHYRNGLAMAPASAEELVTRMTEVA